MEGNTAPYRLHRERNSAHDRPDSRRWHQCCPLNPAETSACPVSKAAFRNLAREGAPVEECVCDGMIADRPLGDRVPGASATGRQCLPGSRWELVPIEPPRKTSYGNATNTRALNREAAYQHSNV